MASSRLSLFSAEHSVTENAGQKLKRMRERLGLRYRDVEQASLSIAQRRADDEFIIALSRLADIENKGTVPTIYRLYSLCTIYRLDMGEVLGWYGVNMDAMAGDAASVEIEKTHLVGFSPSDQGSVQVPIALDPGVDLRKTTYLSRMIQRWGTLPLMMLNGFDLKGHRYGFVGTEDWSMYPIVPPGSLVLIDESRRKPLGRTYATEFDRPIYFFENREGFMIGWCGLDDRNLVVQSHPSSNHVPQIYEYPQDIDIIGQVTGIAIRLDSTRRRRIRS